MKFTKEEVIEFVNKSNCVSDVVRLMGVPPYGGTHTYWKKRIELWEIDTSHWDKSKYVPKQKSKAPKDLLVYDENLSFRPSSTILRRCAKNAGIKYECEICGLKEWLGKELVLPLDHKDGNWKDNRVENLRFLCPNCHSQTGTYTGRKNRVDKYCKCGGKITNNSRLSCQQCIDNRKICNLPSEEELRILTKTHSLKAIGEKYKVCPKVVSLACKDYGIKTKRNLRKKKVKTKKIQATEKYQRGRKPTKEILEKLVWEKPTTKIALEYGVSDKAVSKWCKSYGISKPPRGYWAKQGH